MRKNERKKNCVLINTSEEAANFFRLHISNTRVAHAETKDTVRILYLKSMVPVVYWSSKNHPAGRKELKNAFVRDMYLWSDVTLSSGTANVNCEQFFFFI